MTDKIYRRHVERAIRRAWANNADREHIKATIEPHLQSYEGPLSRKGFTREEWDTWYKTMKENTRDSISDRELEEFNKHIKSKFD